jgi:hypothetical protein
MIQVRLRVCQSGASEKELVELMYGYTIVGGFSGTTWNPYGTPASVDSQIGGGEPLRVATEDHRVPVVASVETKREVPVRRNLPERKPLRAVEAVDTETGVVVPSPTGGVTVVEDEAVVVPSPVCVTGASGSATCN